MTRGAREFVAPLTFAALSRHEVFTEVWGSGNAPAVEHVEARRLRCDLLVVAPGDRAHARQARPRPRRRFPVDGVSGVSGARSPRAGHGIGDVGDTRRCGRTSRRSDRAERRSIGPESGPLASGREGVGRMSEPDAIAAEAWRLAIEPRRDLAGLRLLVTAGPTREPIDPDPLRLEPLERANGLRARRGRARPRSRRHARGRADGAVPGPRACAYSTSRRPTISTPCSCASSPSATASRWPRPSPTSFPRRARGGCTAPRASSRSRLHARARHPGEPRAAAPGTDRRRVRGRDRGPGGARPRGSSRRRAPI